ncbi:Hypothetical_protein [Hexamita inflata]|uniref:Hypothetical_protein n=1 Tax=Hexamita inflata TaxID=28002 RepID=A0AA86P0D8_9EUKA|nr:Hypothetical protein HINF_LOCUS15697 [Hexamita inflata]
MYAPSSRSAFFFEESILDSLALAFLGLFILNSKVYQCRLYLYMIVQATTLDTQIHRSWLTCQIIQMKKFSKILQDNYNLCQEDNDKNCAVGSTQQGKDN